MTLVVFHPDDDHVKLCDFEVKPDDQVGHAMKLVSALTGLRKEAMIPCKQVLTANRLGELGGTMEGLSGALPTRIWEVAKSGDTLKETGYNSGDPFVFSYIGDVQGDLKSSMRIDPNQNNRLAAMLTRTTGRIIVPTEQLDTKTTKAGTNVPKHRAPVSQAAQDAHHDSDSDDGDEFEPLVPM